MISRRGLITGLISFVAAPAIVRVSSLMPVKVLVPDLNEETLQDLYETLRGFGLAAIKNEGDSFRLVKADESYFGSLEIRNGSHPVELGSHLGGVRDYEPEGSRLRRT